MEGKMRLTYFNSRGRAELTRMLFKLAGQEFIDRRVEKGAEWDALKPTTPKGELPILEVDGTMLCESASIARFVARELNLYGANNLEAATCDMVLDTTELVFYGLLDYFVKAKTEEGKAEAMKKIDSGLEALEKFVKLLKKGTFVLGDNASLVDATIHCLFSICDKLSEINCTSYATVGEISKSFSEIPAIAEWIKTRPETPM